MRISDWSSDVCSSDLSAAEAASPREQMFLFDIDMEFLFRYAKPARSAAAPRSASSDTPGPHDRCPLTRRHHPRPRLGRPLRPADRRPAGGPGELRQVGGRLADQHRHRGRPEEHTSALQSLMTTYYAAI